MSAAALVGMTCSAPKRRWAFPNGNGTDQTRDFAISGDELTLVARALPTGGSAVVIQKRAK